MVVSWIRREVVAGEQIYQTGVSFFVVDGREYPVEAYSEAEVRRIPHIVVISAELKENKKVFGCTTQESLEKLLRDKSLFDTYQQLQELQQRKLSPAEQVERVRKATAEFQNLLQQQNIQPHEKDKIIDFVVQHKSGGRTLYLWAVSPSAIGLATSPLVFPTGVSIADLSPFGLDNMALSAMHDGALHILYEGLGFQGRSINLAGTPPFVILDLDAPRYYFGRQVSSIQGL